MGKNVIEIDFFLCVAIIHIAEPSAKIDTMVFVIYFITRVTFLVQRPLEISSTLEHMETRDYKRFGFILSARHDFILDFVSIRVLCQVTDDMCGFLFRHLRPLYDIRLEASTFSLTSFVHCLRVINLISSKSTGRSYNPSVCLMFLLQPMFRLDISMKACFVQCCSCRSRMRCR